MVMYTDIDLIAFPHNIGVQSPTINHGDYFKISRKKAESKALGHHVTV